MHWLSITLGLGLCGLAVGPLLGISLWWGLPAGIVLTVPFVVGCLHPVPSWVCPTITHGAGTRRAIALTFDDGPSPSVTPEVLRLLAERRVPATFFCIGRAARRFPRLARRIAQAGHELGNHGYLHSRHVYLWSARAIQRDARAAQRAIRRASGCAAPLYRPAVGFRSPAMARAMRELGVRLVNFDVRAFDTRASDPDRLVKRIVARVRAGSIIVLHDGDDRDERPDRRVMLAALPKLIAGLKAGGFEFLTVSDLLDAPEPQGAQR